MDSLCQNVALYMVIYRCWDQICVISSHKCEDIWNLRNQNARVCGMIINYNGNYMFTVNQTKINFQLGQSIQYTREQAASCLYLFEPLASELSLFRGSECIHGPTLKWPPPRHPVFVHFSSEMRPELCHRFICLQPWILDLTWGMACLFPFVCWGFGCWWNLPLSSSADHLAQMCWEGVPGGQAVTLSWVVDCSHPGLPCWGPLQ